MMHVDLGILFVMSFLWADLCDSKGEEVRVEGNSIKQE